MSDEIPLSKKDQRKLSAFLGHELLYDYLSQKLDPDRMKAMDQVVQENREIQDEIQSLTSALNYVEHLAESHITENLIQQVRQPTSYFQGLLQKVRFQEWPPGLKLGLEVLIVTSLLAVGAVFLPWQKLTQLNWGQPSDIVLSEVKKEFIKGEQTEEEVAPKQIQANENSSVSFQDETSGPSNHTVPAAATTPVPTANPLPIAPAAPSSTSPPVSSPNSSLKMVAKTPETSTESETEVANGKKQGWLFRGTISVVNLEAIDEKFVAKIAEMGGRKAGEVELGWKKAEGAYFHFTIPEARYEELTKYLGEYGNLKIQKEKHERSMPDGIIRMIITVSESQKKGS